MPNIQFITPPPLSNCEQAVLCLPLVWGVLRFNFFRTMISDRWLCLSYIVVLICLHCKKDIIYGKTICSNHVGVNGSE